MSDNVILPALVALRESQIYRDDFLRQMREVETPDQWAALKARRALINQGQAYQEDGWTLAHTAPGERDTLQIPAAAVEWEIIPHEEQFRVRYCYKVKR